MSKHLRTFFVSVLAVSMMAVGPLAPVALAIDSIDDPPMTFSSSDMTADYNSEVHATTVEITAISSGTTDGRTLIAGLDDEGQITLADWDGDSFNNWTDAWDNYIESQYNAQWTRITSIVYFNEDYIVGGTRKVGGVDQAVVAYLCGICYPWGDHEGVFTDADLAAHASVTGMAYDADNNNLGITVSGPDGLVVWYDAYFYAESFEDVENSAMAGANGPIALYGNSSGGVPLGINSEPSRVDPLSVTGLVRTLMAPPYWVTGTATGSVLATGSSDFGDILPQTLTSPGAGQVFSLDYDWNDYAWLIGVAGNDGAMKLFKDTHSPAVAPAGYTPAATDLGFPSTITENADGEFVGPYYLVGGTGSGGAHLYKWKQATGEFIDFDYLVSDMSSINAVSTQNGGVFFDALRPSTEYFFVGGAGSSVLRRLTETFVLDVTPTPSGTGSSKECGDKTASVTVPDGAINTDYNILVEKVASGTPAAPGGLSLLGNSYEFECFDDSGNPITTFDVPVTITIHYDEADLNGMSEDSLIIYYYDTADSTWKAVVPCIVDKTANTVTITVNHFTQFGILGYADPAMPYTGL